jgi:hypothetical protein
MGNLDNRFWCFLCRQPLVDENLLATFVNKGKMGLAHFAPSFEAEFHYRKDGL